MGSLMIQSPDTRSEERSHTYPICALCPLSTRIKSSSSTWRRPHEEILFVPSTRPPIPCPHRQGVAPPLTFHCSQPRPCRWKCCRIVACPSASRRLRRRWWRSTIWKEGEPSYVSERHICFKVDVLDRSLANHRCNRRKENKKWWDSQP